MIVIKDRVGESMTHKYEHIYMEFVDCLTPQSIRTIVEHGHKLEYYTTEYNELYIDDIKRIINKQIEKYPYIDHGQILYNLHNNSREDRYYGISKYRYNRYVQLAEDPILETLAEWEDICNEATNHHLFRNINRTKQTIAQLRETYQTETLDNLVDNQTTNDTCL